MRSALLNILIIPVQALAWLGRQGTRAIAALVFIGIVVPPIGNVLNRLSLKRFFFFFVFRSCAWIFRLCTTICAGRASF